MSLEHFFLILRARGRLAATIVAGVFLLALTATLLMSKRYTAETQLVIDSKSSDPILGAVLPAIALTSFMNSQVEVIHSPRVAQQAAQILDAKNQTELRQRWSEETGEKGQIEAWYARNLSRNLKVNPARDSNVVTLSYTDTDPERAARIANAFAQAFITVNLDLSVSPARQYAQWFDERAKVQRENLEAAQRRLSDYEKEHRITGSDERIDIENARLGELSSQLVEVQGQHAESKSRQSLSGAMESLPEVLQNSLIRDLKADLTRLEMQREQLAGRAGVNHPELTRVKSEIATLQDRIHRETQRIAHSLQTSDRMRGAQESEIRRALEQQRARVIELKTVRDNVMVLRKEVESAQRSFDLVTQRLSQTSLESENRQTNVVVLTPASEPLQPSSPKIALNLLLGLVFGTLLAAGVVLVAELIAPRVRGRLDLEKLGLPILAELPMAETSGRIKLALGTR